jgi:hypothetical protein
MQTQSVSILLCVGLGLGGCVPSIDGVGFEEGGGGSDSVDDGDDGGFSADHDDDTCDDDDGAVPPTGACVSDLTPSAFEFPTDEASCAGPQYTRFVPEQGLWLGLVSCGDGSMRFYLAASDQGPFFQATDWAGNGQDHCELVRPGFVLPNEDEITTGCAECSTGTNFPLEYQPAYARGNVGELFEFVPQTGEWSYQYSRIDCGCGL